MSRQNSGPSDDRLRSGFRHYLKQRGVVLGVLGAFLWLYAVLNILWPETVLRRAAMVGLGFYLLVSIRQTDKMTRVIAAICISVTLLSLAAGAPLDAASKGLDTVLLFMGFLPAISLIGVMIEQSGALERLSAQVERMPAREQEGATLIAAHAIGAVMTVGAFAAVAPPFERMEDETARQHAGLFAIRGVSLAVMWTPFTVGMGYASANAPTVPLWLGIGCGVPIAIIGLLVSLGEWNPLKLGHAFALVRQMLWPIVGAALALIGLNALTGLSGMKLVILTTPLAVGIWFLGQGHSAQRMAGRKLFDILGGLGNTMWLFTGSITMGAVLSQTPAVLDVLTHLGLETLPPAAIFGVLVAASIAMACAGLHSTVIGAVIVAVTAGLVDQLGALAVFLLILFGWQCGAMLSMSSLAVAMATRSFHVPLPAIVLGRNLRFAILFGTILIGVYAVWTGLFGLKHI